MGRHLRGRDAVRDIADAQDAEVMLRAGTVLLRQPRPSHAPRHAMR